MPLCLLYFADGMNYFVDVRFEQTLTGVIICEFMSAPFNDTEQCIANITYGTDCSQTLGIYEGGGIGHSIRTSLLNINTDEDTEYCFTVTASTQVVTVKVEGRLNLLTAYNAINGDTLYYAHCIYYNICNAIMLSCRY